MSKLSDLITELCPDGVEYKRLGDEYRRIKGTPITAGKMHEIENPCGNVKIFAGGSTIVNANIDDIPNANVSYSPSVIVQSRGIVNFIYYDAPFTFKNEMWAYTCDNKISVKYLYYLLLNNVEYFREIASRTGSLPQISIPVTDDYQIPVPPLEVQEEIVRILDAFSELQAELQAELQDRKKQYEYYRDEMFNFENPISPTISKMIEEFCPGGVPYKTLGDIATDIYRGSGIKRDQVTEFGIPCVRYGEIYTTYNIHFDQCVSHTDEMEISPRKFFEHGDILFAITGESVEEIAKSIAYLGYEKCLAGGDIAVLKHKQNPKYLSYILSTTICQDQKSKGKVKSKVVHSSVPDIKSIVIPVPPLEIQNEIVSILDSFYTLCGDLTHGLPAEIDARRKQYEYYRDCLLTFKPKESTA